MSWDPPEVALAGVSDADLATLLTLLDRGELRPPCGAAVLQSRGLSHLTHQLEPYLAFDVPALRAVLTAVSAERYHRPIPKLSLVWSGDDPGVGRARYTRVLLPELFAQARKHVLVAGYSFDHVGELFSALHEVMARHGVVADFYLDIQQLVERLRSAAKSSGGDWAVLSAPLEAAPTPEARGNAAAMLFLRLMWPFGEPHPRIWFDPRTADTWSMVSLHAKCVVIDRQLTLITSANFTERGQQRNYEAGVTIDDASFATGLERQWANLAEAGLVRRAV